MSILNQITTGKKIKAMIHALYGVEGVGKSSWAAGFPNPLFIDLEDGSSFLDVARITDVPDLAAFKKILTSLIGEAHNYQTVVIDSLEALEVLLNEAVCKEAKVMSIEDIPYGKGHARAREFMQEIMKDLRILTQKKNVTVIIIGHAQCKTHTDPAENTAFERYTMRVNEKLGAIVKDLADNLFFCTHRVFVSKDKGKTQAFSNGERVLRTSWRAGYDAKTRLNLPHELPLSYEAFIKACEETKPATVHDLKTEISELVKGIPDEETRAVALKRTNDATTIKDLEAIKNRVLELTKTA